MALKAVVTSSNIGKELIDRETWWDKDESWTSDRDEVKWYKNLNPHFVVSFEKTSHNRLTYVRQHQRQSRLEAER